MPDKITLLGLDPARVHAIVHGLAYMRTLISKSAVGNNYYNIFYVPLVQELQPSSLSIGENYNNKEFVRWVREEEVRLYQNFDHACDLGSTSANHWLSTARGTAYGFQQNYREMVESLNQTNARMASMLTGSLRAAATVQAVAEIALTVVGLLGTGGGVAVAAVGGEMVPTASLALNTAAGMTLKLGLQKMAVGVTSSLAIDVAEKWTDAKTADVWLVPMGVAGSLSDCFKDFLQWRRAKLLGQVQAALMVTKGSDAAGYAARQALLAQKGVLSKPVQTGTTGVIFTGAAWVLAAWNIKGSLVKLHDRW